MKFFILLNNYALIINYIIKSMSSGIIVVKAKIF